MAIDKKFINQFANVTQKAALASSYFIGKKNKIAADKAAVDSMRVELNKIKMTVIRVKCTSSEYSFWAATNT